MIRANVQETVGAYLSTLLDVELTDFLGRDRYERSERQINHRNGSYGRKFTLKGIGKVDLRVRQDRKGEFKTEVIPRSRQHEDALQEDLSVMFLGGVSTRILALISERVIGRRISAGEVSKVSSQLSEAIEKWRERDLSKEGIKYLFVDGTLFSMRVEGCVEKVCVLVAIGVTADGCRTVLRLQGGDKESASNWRELFKDLKRRGLDGSMATLGIMDGLSGLEGVLMEEFPNAKVQRCQLHVARREKVPSAVKCLENSLHLCLTYLQFPDEEWICLRTANIIERVNKEFNRRTKPMEILAGERSCYTLLAFICLKMELTWRSKPIRKVPTNLPFLKRLAETNFTQ